jgi:VWFA-related protein
MTWYATVAYVLGLLLLSNPPPVRAQDTNQTRFPNSVIHVSVDRVNVGVTVTGSHGNFIKGLRREDFRIFDNDVEQSLTGFLSSDEPSQLVLLIESSTPDYLLAKLGRSLFIGANGLLRSVSPSDRVAIITYSDRPELVFDFSPDKVAAQFALQELNAQLLSSKVGSNAMNLASSLATTLDWLGSVPGKKTIVLLSTGVDTSSEPNWQLTDQKLKTSDVRILAVSMFGDFRKPAKAKRLSPDQKEDRKYVKGVFAEADQWLRDLSAATGGRVYLPKNVGDFDRAYAEIAQLVRCEYSLEFALPVLDGKLHTIKVKAKHSWFHVEHRQSYLAPPPPSH